MSIRRMWKLSLSLLALLLANRRLVCTPDLQQGAALLSMTLRPFSGGVALIFQGCVVCWCPEINKQMCTYIYIYVFLSIYFLCEVLDVPARPTRCSHGIKAPLALGERAHGRRKYVAAASTRNGRLGEALSSSCPREVFSSKTLLPHGSTIQKSGLLARPLPSPQ